MSNTRDSIGDQATVDGLINHTLESLEEDGVISLANYALYKNTGLKSVSFPNLTNTGTYAFQNCTALESANLPEVTAIGNYAFSGCSKLKSVSAPKVTTINQYAFQNCKNFNGFDMSPVKTIGNYAFSNSGVGKLVLPVCTSLGTYTGQGNRMSEVDLTGNITIAANMFNGAVSLTALILRSATMRSLANANALTGTALANGIGYIYVPTDLVDTYKAATNWANYASQIVPISEYPKALQDETISDTWAEIFAAEDNGTYSTKYSIGDIKYLDVGGTQVAMQIVGFDLDTLAAGGTAKITWISKGLVELFAMNPTDTTVGGWEDCALREWLREIIYPQVDATVRSQIKTVAKTFKDYSSNSTETVSDTIWIPSSREIFGGTSIENSGPVYSGIFTDAASRIKRNGLGSVAGYWWLRSASSASGFRCVGYVGAEYNNTASTIIGVALGFCT